MRETDSLVISPLPWVKAERVPVGVLMENGCLEGEKNARILYCKTALPALRRARERGGIGIMSKSPGGSSWTRFQIGTVTIFPGCVTNDPEEIIGFRDFCYGEGIAARSISAMAFYLMRNTLAGSFEVSKGNDIPWDLFPTGPRMHSEKGVFSNVYQSDIRSAYLWAISRFSPVRTFRAYRSAKPCDVQPDGFFLIRVRLPDAFKWGTVPMLSETGKTVYPTVFNYWSNPILLSGSDARAALAVGAKVKILRAWLPSDAVTEPFRDFGILIQRLRRESAFPRIAKQAGNTLWGSFVASPDLRKVTFTAGGRKHKAEKLPQRSKICPPLGYSVMSSIRSRLMMEAIGTETLHAHTDGIIAPFPIQTGESPGEWRTEFYKEVEILGPSWYKTVSPSGDVIYRIAGRKGNDERSVRQFSYFRETVLSENRMARREWEAIR